MRLRTAVYLLAGIILPVLFYRSASTFSPHSYFARRPTARAMWTPADAALQAREQQARQPNRRQPPPPQPPPPPLPPQQQRRPGAAKPRQMAPPVGVNASAAPRAWSRRPNLIVNGPAQALLDRLDPSRTTLHFTFGSIVMLDFVHNWRHFVERAGLSPVLVGAADRSLLNACEASGVAAAGIAPELDVWSYERRTLSAAEEKKVFDLKSDWKYYRHHKSSFLEMGLVKAAFLWELVSAGFDVLISDLDVVWLNGHWARWMSWAQPAEPPLPEAALIALADVLVSTDEIDAGEDRAPRWGYRGELNTGVLFFRATDGSLAVIQLWREAMMKVRTVEFINDQTLFNQVMSAAGLQRVEGGVLATWKAVLEANGAPSHHRLPAAIGAATRGVWLSAHEHSPCVHAAACTKRGARFSFGTLPMRAFTNGHTWFNQDVAHMAGHHEPRFEPVTVHFTFQFGDTKEYPHGKRQRAREAALWSVDPPEYFTEGVYVHVVGALYTDAQVADVYRRFPEWSPQRHMHMDALQRSVVRDLLALSIALDGIMIMPKLHCFCDRYWNFLAQCRYPIGPSDMPIPFGCPQDALYDLVRWNSMKVRFREHTFLDNPHVPAALRENTVRLRVRGGDGAPPATWTGDSAAEEVTVNGGTSMAAAAARVIGAHPHVRLVEVHVDELRLLCKWLGSAESTARFNALMRYVLTDSSRYCPREDHRFFSEWDWRNPFTAYNCTWGFHYPTPYSESPPCGDAHGGSRVAERTNSTTCPRQMLCGWNTQPDGSESGKITFCNIEGYGGVLPQYKPAMQAMLARMPDGRCPYPPGDRPGGGPGLDADGHWVGVGRGA